MFKKYMLLLLLGHIIGDFYTQTKMIADKKEEKLSWTLIHGFIYFVTVVIISFPFMSKEIIIMDISVSVLHLLIDIGKYYWIKNYQRTYRKELNSERNIFLVDQLLHLCCLVGVSYYMAKQHIALKEMSMIADFFDVVGISEMALCSWCVSMLVIHKPANILIQKVIGAYKPKVQDDLFQRDHNAGRLIGTIERGIMLILIFINQYSAIGLVLTAKSIARYDRISKDEKFAEYYLLGTLMSTAIVISCAIILL